MVGQDGCLIPSHLVTYIALNQDFIFKDVRLYILLMRMRSSIPMSNCGFLIFPTTNKISGDSIKIRK